MNILWDVSQFVGVLALEYSSAFPANLPVGTAFQADPITKPPSLFANSRGVIVSIAAFSAICNFLLLVVPFYSIQVFDRVLSSGSFETLIMLSLAAGGALVFYGLFELFRTRLLVRLGAGLEARHGPIMLMREMQGAQVSGSPLQDLRELSGYVASSSFVNLLDAPWCPVFVALIWAINPTLGVIALVACFIFLIIGLISDRITRGCLDRARLATSALSEMAAQFRRLRELARAMGLIPNIVARWRILTQRSVVANLNSGDRVGAMSSLARFLRLLVQITLMGVGISLVLRQELTPGVLIAVSLLLSRALAPVEQSIGAVRAFANAKTAYKRLSVELAAYEAAADQMPLPEPRGDVTVNDVTLVVEGRKEPILEKVSLDVPAGTVLAVIGPSGSGKSTLLRMMAGVQPATDGTIRIDGAKLQDWPAQQIGERIGYLPQDVELLTGSIAENIAGFTTDIQSQQVMNAAKVANLEGLVQQLPNGFNTIVGPGLNVLSGGQRQRVGLARALHGDRKILLLDEPDAHLDDEGQAKLMSTIRAARASGVTVIFTSHRKTMLAVCDAVAVLIDGRVTKVGDAKSVLSSFSKQAVVPPPLPSVTTKALFKGQTTDRS